MAWDGSGTAPGPPRSPPGWSACGEPPVVSFLRDQLTVGAHRTSGHGPDASRREGPPALQDRAGLGEHEKCQHATLAGEARSDDQSDQLRHQAPRTTVQDRQTMASAPTPTPSEDGHPAAHRSRLPEGLEGSGTGPMADAPHLRRGGPEEVAHGSTRRRRSCTMADLRTRYLGLDLRSPLVASSSPLTGTLDGLRRLEAAGAGRGGAALAVRGGPGRGDTTGRRAAGHRGDRRRSAPAPGPGRLRRRAGRLPGAGRPGQGDPVDPGDRQPERRVPGRLGPVRRPLEEAGADALELNIYYVSSRPGAGRQRGRAALPGAGPVGPPGHRRSRWRSSSAPISAPWPTWPASWPRPVPTGWCCSTASTSPTWTSRPWRSPPAWSCRTSTELRLPLRWIAILHRRSGPRWPPRPGSTPPPTWSRC